MKATDTAISASARCGTCVWECHARNAMAAGSLHAEKHRHAVVVREERLIYFDGTPRAKREEADARLPL